MVHLSQRRAGQAARELELSLNPLGLKAEKASAGAGPLLAAMTQTFNATLAAELAPVEQVLMVDTYAASLNQAVRPGDFGFTNTTTPACDPAKAPFGALTCTAATLIEGDTSHFKWADSVHPAFYASAQLASLVRTSMKQRG